MAMMGSQKGGGAMLSEINVTPMVDVMLVLLIIFMVATPMIKKEENAEQREVDIDLPVTKDNPNVVSLEDTTKIILKIDEKLRVRIGDVVITDCSAQLGGADPKRYEPCFEEIESKLLLNARLQEEKTLFLLAHPDIPYGFVVGSMNRIKRAGVNNVGMVTNPEYLPAEGKGKGKGGGKKKN